MSTLLVTTVLALGCGAQPPGGTGAGGKWLIVYAEEGGRRNNAWEQRQAVMSKGTLTYEAEGGKKRSLKLKFGPHQNLEATLSEGAGAGKMQRGVYILGQDYLCISLQKGGKGAGARGAGGAGANPATARPAAAGAQAGHSSGDFILILRRQRGGKK